MDRATPDGFERKLGGLVASVLPEKVCEVLDGD